jgi:hypothetical protein
MKPYYPSNQEASLTAGQSDLLWQVSNIPQPSLKRCWELSNLRCNTNYCLFPVKTCQFNRKLGYNTMNLKLTERRVKSLLMSSRLASLWERKKLFEKRDGEKGGRQWLWRIKTRQTKLFKIFLKLQASNEQHEKIQNTLFSLFTSNKTFNMLNLNDLNHLKQTHMGSETIWQCWHGYCFPYMVMLTNPGSGLVRK